MLQVRPVLLADRVVLAPLRLHLIRERVVERRRVHRHPRIRLRPPDPADPRLQLVHRERHPTHRRLHRSIDPRHPRPDDRQLEPLRHRHRRRNHPAIRNEPPLLHADRQLLHLHRRAERHRRHSRKQLGVVRMQVLDLLVRGQRRAEDVDELLPQLGRIAREVLPPQRPLEDVLVHRELGSDPVEQRDVSGDVHGGEKEKAGLDRRRMRAQLLLPHDGLPCTVRHACIQAALSHRSPR
jgi:hypothetical protein